MNTAELRQAEIDQAEKVADAAAVAAANPLSRTTVAASTKLIAELQHDDARGAVLEPVADVAAIASDSELAAVLNADVVLAGLTLRTSIPEWIATGWQAEADGQAAILKETAPALSINASLSADERKALAAYPVNGHTPQAIAMHNARRLEYDVQGALGLLLVDAATARDVPAALSAIERQHAERVRSIAREAFFAGCQAARVAIGKALAGK